MSRNNSSPIRHKRGFWQSSAARYGLAAAITLTALAVTFMTPLLRGRPYILSAIGVFAAAWVGGAGPAVFAVLLATGGVNLALAIGGQAFGLFQAVQGIVFIGVGLFVVFLTKARIASDREARRQAARLEAMFQQASVGIALADLEGRLLRMNTRLAQIIGRQGEAAEAITLADLTHPEEWQRDRAIVERIAAATLKHHVADTRFRQPDGVSVWVHVSMAPMLDADGRPEGLVLVVEDVSLRRQQDDRLRASEDRYRSLVDASMAIVWTSDAQGAFHPPQESWSAVTGQAAWEYRGWGWSQVLHADDRPSIEHLWRRAIEQRQAVDAEVRVWNATIGAYRWYSARAVPRFNARGEVVEWVGACTDIHERRLAEIQLRESDYALRRADREKDDFLALLAHELRNPLAPIRTAVELLRTRAQDPDMLRLHAVIERQVRHLVRMVDDLLDVSRVLRGKIELRIERLELAPLVAVAVETSRPLIDGEGQQLIVELPDRPISLLGDQVRLSQVISNLLNNASKYTARGGIITLRAGVHDDSVLLQVCDTGAGIAADILPRIFEPFVQGDRTLERARGGLGIGLTLVRQIVELHGGHVTARSGGSGQGSEFEVSLPLAGDPRIDDLERAQRRADLEVPSPLRLMVVDDNVDAALTLAALLTTYGHEVRTAHSGMDALALADVWSPVVAILDIGLPQMSGYELAVALRGRGDAAPELIAVTGYGEPQHAQQAQEAGFRHHLVKPVDAADLIAAIADCGNVRASRSSAGA